MLAEFERKTNVTIAHLLFVVIRTMYAPSFC